jgi:heptosyltransferase-2
LREKWIVASDLKAKRFDCAILFPNALEAAAIVFAAGIPKRIGYAADGRSLLLTDAVKLPAKHEIPRHQRFWYLELLRRAGIIDDLPAIDEIRLSGADSAAEAGRMRLQAVGMRRGVVGVSPGAAYGGAKRWLADRFADAAVEVARACDADVAVFGSKEEIPICEAVHRKIEAAGRRSQNFAGMTSLPDFIELAAACEVMLTNDSGPMHIASALGVPTVAVFGATDEFATGPTGPQSRVIREPVECSPCLLRECPIDHRCMTRVDAKRVSEAALQVIAGVKK